MPGVVVDTWKEAVIGTLQTSASVGDDTDRTHRLPDVWIRCNLKMASVNRKLICTIFDSQQIHASSSLRSSLALLPDPENMGTAVGISWLWCIEAELYVMSFLPPVNGRQLLCTIHSYIRQ